MGVKRRPGTFLLGELGKGVPSKEGPSSRDTETRNGGLCFGNESGGVAQDCLVGTLILMLGLIWLSE